MKDFAVKFTAIALLVAGISSHAMAALVAPEIDPGMGLNALALLGGAIVLIRSRRK